MKKISRKKNALCFWCGNYRKKEGYMMKMGHDSKMSDLRDFFENGSFIVDQ